MAIKTNINQVIIDSGPLLIALTINFIDKNELMDLKVKNDLLRRAYPNIHKLPLGTIYLSKFFKIISKFYTTPHVIGEIIGLAKSRLNLKNELYNKFWEISIPFLKSKNISEELITLIELYNDSYFNKIIQNIGFVDTELLKFSIMTGKPIISVDKRTLKSQAIKQNVEVVILEDYIFENIDILKNI